MYLTEDLHPETDAPFPDETSSLKSELKSAQESIEILQAAFTGQQADAIATSADLYEQISNLRITLQQAIAERDNALTERDDLKASLARREVQQELQQITPLLHPQLARVVSEQLSACASAEEVRQRWARTEAVLSAAGLSPLEPTGVGQTNPGDQPGNRLKPHQQIQRRLLNL